MISQPVLWIDPGKVTGIAVYDPSARAESQRAVQDEYAFMQAADQIEAICKFYGKRLLIGWEAFIIGPQTHKKSADAHHSIEMIGVARRAALVSECTILTSAKPDERNLATPDMVRAVGWWRPGKDDAQSAAQHLLAWMLRTDSLPAAEAVKLAALRDQDQGDR